MITKPTPNAGTAVASFTLAPTHPAWLEYDGAADQLACKGLKGGEGDALPDAMTLEAVQLINADPEAFQMRVRQCAYARAMERSAK